MNGKLNMANCIALISDIHIGNNKDNPIFHKITLDYGIWLRDQLNYRNITKLVIAGDLLHSRTSISLPTLQTAHEFLDIFSDFEVVITTGNHDAWFLDNSTITSLSVFKNRMNVKIIDSLTIEDNITYCPWGTIVDDLPEQSDIVIGHWDIQSFEMSKGKVSSHGIKAADLMKKCKCVFSGHYHKKQQRLYTGRPLTYLGSAFQLNFGESDNTNLVHILDTNTLELTTLENTISPRFKYIHDNDSLDDIEGHFISVVSDDAELKARVDACNPLFARQELLDDVNKVDNDSKEIKEFKVVDVEEAIIEFCNTSLTQFTFDEEDCKIVANALNRMYIQLK